MFSLNIKRAQQRLWRKWVECLLSVCRKNLPVEADIQNLLLFKQSAFNYTAILPNINLVGSEFELTEKYEFSGYSLKRGTVYIWKGVLVFTKSALKYFPFVTKLTAFLEYVDGLSDMFLENYVNRSWDTAEKTQPSSLKVLLVIQSTKT
jgi:hypothetical protein